MAEINPSEIYTTDETRHLLRISSSTIKRLLKRGMLRANKVGGRYRILGKEILRILSPEMEKRASSLYQKAKQKTKKALKDW